MTIKTEAILSPLQVRAVYRVLKAHGHPIFDNSPITGSVETFLNTILTRAKHNCQWHEIAEGRRSESAFRTRTHSWARSGIMHAVFEELHHIGDFHFTLKERTGKSAFRTPDFLYTPPAPGERVQPEQPERLLTQRNRADSDLLTAAAKMESYGSPRKSLMSTLSANPAAMALMARHGGTMTDVESDVTFQHMGDRVRYSKGGGTLEFPVEATADPEFQTMIEMIIAA